MWLVTVDLGNTRAKLAVWRGDEVVERVVGVVGAALPDSEARTAAVSSVADEARTAEVVAWLAQAGLEVVLAPGPGIANACEHPETTGMDRLYAARAAVDLVGGACLVVDCGTALTVDAVVAEGGGPRFLGGAIAAGPAPLARAVADGGARLPAFSPQPGDPALGMDTDRALRAGVAVGLRGAARELVERIAGEAGLGAAPAVLTGGARAFLLEPAAFTDRDLTVAPDLVHRGVRAALLEARGGRG